jgi:hypothetical protein
MSSKAIVVQGEADEDEGEDTTFLALHPNLQAAASAAAPASTAAPAALDSTAFLADEPAAAPASGASGSAAAAAGVAGESVPADARAAATAPAIAAPRSQLERSLREKNERVRLQTCARTSAFYVAVNKELHKAQQRLGKSVAVVQDALNTSAGVAQSLASLNQKLEGLQPVL